MFEDLPYPGLRPFNSDETHIFFGREEQTDELLRRLSEAPFLAVVGLSGCGKSSLIRAGLLAALETGLMTQAGSRWRFAVMRPGGHPMRRLARALIEQAGLPIEGVNPENALGFLIATLRRGPLGLVEALAETPLPSEANLLIVVDQFEEIFRFRREGDRDEADAFVSLLLASTRQRRFPVYVVITMRSDFVGDCAVFNGLPEAINESQFLAPRLTRDQREAAIVGPARVFGGDIEPALVTRLLNEMGADPDQLPLLQHLLMRMWMRHSGTAGGEAAVTEAAAGGEAKGRVLSVRDYEAVGGMKDALSRHADEALACLDAGQQRIAELVFRRLSERGSDQRDIRRPTRAGEIAALADVPLADLLKVIDVFRAPGSNFLTPPWPEPIRAETVLDISHESLIRQWSRLRYWAEQEAQSAETYRFLEQTTRRWRNGQAALWSTPDLENALVWRQRQQPTPAWAERYGGDFALAMDFLDRSEQKRREEEASTERQRRRQLRRLRLTVAGLAALCLCLIGSALLIFYLFRFYDVEVAGIYPTPYYTTLVTRQAYFTEPDGSRQLLENPRLHSVEIEYSLEEKGYAKIRREYDAHGNAVKEEHLNEKGVVAVTADGYALIERTFDDRDRIVEEAYYGTSKKLIESSDGYAVVHEKYEPLNNVSEETYLDVNRNQIARHEGYAVLRKKYDDHDRVVEEAYFDMNGEPVASVKGYAVVRTSFENGGRTYELSYFDAANRPARDNDDGCWNKRVKKEGGGHAIEIACLDEAMKPMRTTKNNFGVRRKYDERENLVEEAFFDENGGLFCLSNAYALLRQKYDKHGRLIEQAFFGADGNLLVQPAGYATVRKKYDEGGRLVEQAFLGADEKLLLQPRGYAIEHHKYDNFGHKIEESYFDQNEKPICRDALYAEYCAIEYGYDDAGLRRIARYMAPDGSPLITMNYSYNAEGKLIGATSNGKDGEALAYRELVLAAIPGLQAEHLLLPGDIILRYAGTDIDNPESLSNLTKDTLGGPRELVIRRNNELVNLQAQPGRLGFWDQPAFETYTHTPTTLSH